MEIAIRRLEASDDTESFDCNDASLNEYLKRYARQNQERHMYGVTYVALPIEAANRIFGYYTISSYSYPKTGLPEFMTQGHPRYADVPAILLGRLAVDKTCAKCGIGHALMTHCLDLSVRVSKQLGARYLITDAYASATGWYERYNFRQIVGSNNLVLTKMFLDLKVARSAIDLRESGAMA